LWYWSLKSGFADYFVQEALNSSEFVERFSTRPTQRPWILEQRQKSWDEFFKLSSNTELKQLQNRLITHTDELSCEVVARYIARRLFCMEYTGEAAWSILSRLLRLIYPLDYAEQERIKSLAKAYRCPYKLPDMSYEHMATGFGINQFSPDVQKRLHGKDIIDGGGYCGDSAMVFTEYDPRKVYAFEPNPEILPVMKQVIAENAAILGDRKDRIEIVPAALGKSKGTLTLHSDGELDGGATTLPTLKAKKYEVNVISIDEFVQKHALEIGLIKLDVEGAEYDTILGAKETIMRQKPLLLISIYHTFKDFFEIKPLIESWDVGYKFEIRDHHPSRPDPDFMLMGY